VKIVVCIKQVPEIALVSVDDSKGELKLPQSPGMVNPFDSYAIEEALRLKEKHGGTVIVLSLGGKEAEYALREGLALGADEAVHLTDNAFGGLDAIAVATALAAGVEKIGEVDLVLLGKQAVDSDASSVSSAVGGALNWPAVMFVRKIENVADGKLTVERMTDSGFDQVEIATPAVLSVVKEINEPRLPSLKGKMMAKKKELKSLSAADLGLDLNSHAFSGRTELTKSASPPERPKGEIISGETPAEIAEKLFRKLREDQVI